MTVDKEKILQLESDAKTLVENLKELHKRAEDYHTVTNKLDEANNTLADLILTTKTLTEQSHNIIKHINDIGSSKIFDDLVNIKNENKKILIILEGIKKDNKGLVKTSEILINKNKKQFVFTLSLLIILIIINVVFSFFPNILTHSQ
jgi:hypothetical protein